MKKKIIAVDLDDVLMDFNNPLFGFYNEKHDTHHKLEDLTSYQVESAWGCPQEKALEIIKQFYVSKEHKTALPKKGAVKALSILKKDFRLVVITARSPEFKEISERWINFHFLNTFESIHFSHKKSEICDELGVELFIDDALHNALDVGKPERPVYLFDAPWNQKEDLPEHITRVKSWEEIMEKLSLLRT